MAQPGNLKHLILLAIMMPAIVACNSISKRPPGSYLASYQDFPPQVSGFQVCHDDGCENLTAVQLSDDDWQQLYAQFKPAADTPHHEREQIRQAIALFERIAGPLTRTENDARRNDSGERWADRQRDCVAETVNTTTYLLLFQQQGWLRWHVVGFPQPRGFFSLLGPHNTAVVVERGSGKKYVVDSWFHRNGALPEIVSSEQWAAGYDPEDQQWRKRK